MTKREDALARAAAVRAAREAEMGPEASAHFDALVELRKDEAVRKVVAFHGDRLFKR